VLNRHEAALLTGRPDADATALARAVAAQSGATVVVIKQGPRGALVLEAGEVGSVPAYQSPRVWKIGSGDTFAAHFAVRWMLQERSAMESADLASQGTAYYCGNRGFASTDELDAYHPTPVIPSARYLGGFAPRVYLAGPFFSLAQLWLVEQARVDLRAMGLSVFSPYHDVGQGSAEDVVGPDL